MTVYFATAKSHHHGPVKIGVSGSVETRLSGLQTSNHEELEIIATMSGGRETEAYLHESLASSRIRGEWYLRTPELNAAMRRAQTIGSAALALTDPGYPAFVSAQCNKDVAEAQRLAQAICDLLAPSETSPRRYALLYRRLSKSHPGLTLRRARALCNAEVRRVDSFEMNALSTLLHSLQEEKNVSDIGEWLPKIRAHLASEGAPLRPDQLAVLDRALGDAR